MTRYKNTFQQGIAVKDLAGHLPAEVGAPEHGGVPKLSAEVLSEQGKYIGIPMPGPGMLPDEEDLPAAQCAALTKKGKPCKAYATSNSVFCVAHSS